MKSILFFLSMMIQNMVYANTPLFVVSEDLPPLNYIENDTIKGHHTYLVEALLKLANIDYSMAILPWARSYRIAQTQPNVLIYTINHTDARHDKFHWIAQFPTKLAINYYALESSNFSGLPLSELKKLRIGTEFDTANHDFVADNGFSKITRVSHIRQTVGMLERKRIDIVIASPEQIEKAIEESGVKTSNVINLGNAFTAKPSIAVSLSTPLETVKKLKDTYAQLNQDINLCTLMKVNKPLCTLN